MLWTFFCTPTNNIILSISMNDSHAFAHVVFEDLLFMRNGVQHRYFDI